VQDGNNDYDAIRKAINDAKAVTDKPTIIKVQDCGRCGVQTQLLKIT